MPIFIKPLWSALVAAYPLYVSQVVGGAGEGADSSAHDADGDPTGVAPFIYESFDFFRAILLDKKLAPLVLAPLPSHAFTPVVTSGEGLCEVIQCAVMCSDGVM